MDKRWDRSLEEQPTYVIFAPNYRMNELSGAVALAQVHKMRNTVALRRARGNLLRELSKNPYVVLQRILGGCKHTYWLYAMRVTDKAPFTPDDFAMAIRAEGISCTPHFFGRPVFLSHEAIRNQRLFGNSRFPFDHPDANPVSYDENTAPNAQKVYNWMVVGYARPAVNQQWATQFLSEEDIHDIARTIRKVSRLLRTKWNLVIYSLKIYGIIILPLNLNGFFAKCLMPMGPTQETCCATPEGRDQATE